MGGRYLLHISMCLLLNPNALPGVREYILALGIYFDIADKESPIGSKLPVNEIFQPY